MNYTEDMPMEIPANAVALQQELLKKYMRRFQGIGWVQVVEMRPKRISKETFIGLPVNNVEYYLYFCEMVHDKTDKKVALTFQF